MKRDILQKQYKTAGLFRTFIADIICFFVITVLSVGFCYSYFSDKVDVLGDATTATIAVSYQDGAGAKLTNITAKVNGGASAGLNGIQIAPGDTITITGNAVSIGDEGTAASATADAYLLAELNIVNKDASGNIIDEETVWYNVVNNKVVYVERGLFQVGASVLQAGATQALSIPYTFEGDKYNENYQTISLALTLHTHQKAFLDLAEDYNNYSAVGTYSKESIYATHRITGRKRDVWEDADATVTGLTLADLETDESGAYLINSCNDWMIMRATSTSANTYHQGKTFKLNSYLDFNNNTTPKSIDQLQANIDGQGYTISNWTDENGLINIAQCNIVNIGVDGIRLVNVRNVTIWNYAVGGIAGQLKVGTIDNCFVVGLGQYDSGVDYDFNLNASSQCIGGIVGNIRGDGTASVSTIIKDCYSILNIYKIYETAKVSCVGGVYGEAYPTTVSVDNCYFYGSITNINDAAKYNGLIGGNCNGRGTINNCVGISFATITDTGTTKMVAMQNSDVKNCMYITSDETFSNPTAIKVGMNQTSKSVTVGAIESVGLMRDAFGWDTNIWATDIYGDTGCVVLRAFYNY